VRARQRGPASQQQVGRGARQTPPGSAEFCGAAALPAEGPGSEAPRSNMTWVAALVAGGFFMELLDGTVIATALPQMARSFGVTPIDLNLGMTAYILTLAVFIPLSGWAAERFGARTVFGTAVAVFTLSSALCGFSQGLWSFTAARVLQGFGGALMVPVGRLLVLRETPKSDLVRAIAILTWPALLAPVLGPPLGGFITAFASWRWIFFLNLPIGLAGFGLTMILVRNERQPSSPPLDWIGFGLVGTFCVLFVCSLSLVGSTTENWSTPAGLFAAALVSGGLAVWWLGRHRAPILDFFGLGVLTYTVGVRAGTIQRTAISAAPFLLPLLFQEGFGVDPFTSGLLVLVLFAGNVCMKPATTAVLRRFGFKRVLIGNGLILAASLFGCGLLRPGAPHAIVWAVLFIGGASRSMQMTALSTITYADIPQARMRAANTLDTLLQQLSYALGIAVGAIALRVGALLLGTSPRSLSLADFRIAFMLVAALALLGLIDSLRLAPDAAALVSGHCRGA
jgi:EmrB/QacA subfamily drug resistance transporter